MARPKKTLTKDEIKAKKTQLKEALKTVNETFSKFESDHKAAQKALTAAQKVANTAAKKLEKAQAARDTGKAKIDQQLAALAPVAA